MSWKESRYTHRIDLDDGGGVLYNGFNGAIVQMSAAAYREAGVILDSLTAAAGLPGEMTESAVFPHLVAGGFVIDDSVDELVLLRDQYESERKRSRFLITLLPTFDCNMSCGYCFMGKKEGTMSQGVQSHLVRFVEDRMNASPPLSMTVDWLGGEPLLALGIIRSLSSQFQRLCRDRGIPYEAQVITNGTLITPEAVRALEAAGVERLQVTVDGPSDVHDERRRFKTGRRSSFAAIMEGLGHAVGRFSIRLRMNVDSRNLDYVLRLIDEFERRGWLGPETGFYPYLARTSPFTAACADVAKFACDMDRFYAVDFELWERLQHLGVPVAFQPLYLFPEPRLYSCGAIGSNGYVFNPDGTIHKCGLTIDDPVYAIGRVDEPLDLSQTGSLRWLEYSPFANLACRECKFLPTCLGGCPRDQILKHESKIKDTCLYYHQFEERILKFHLCLNKRSAAFHGRMTAERCGSA